MRVAIGRLLDAFVGGTLGLGALSFLLSPAAGLHDEVAVLLGPTSSLWVATLLAMITGIEGFLAWMMIVMPGARSRRAAAILVVSLSVYLVVLGTRQGWSARCTCMAVILEQTAGVGLLRNAALIAALVVARRLSMGLPREEGTCGAKLRR